MDLIVYPACIADITNLSVILRLLLAVFIGGAIGLERGASHHTAGFRTHILVCVGACLAMMTNQYIFETISDMADPARLGAQVITGVGFLGVGTIIVTGRHKIKGLTTAAGLWASACIGLALGIGFYSAAIIAAVLIFISLTAFQKIEQYFYSKASMLDLYIEIDSIYKFKTFRSNVRQEGIEVYETHISKSDPVSPGGIAFHTTIKVPKDKNHGEIIEWLSTLDGVYLVEEI